MRSYISVFIFLLLLTNFSFASKESSTCEKTEKILYLIKKLHYQSPEFNSAFTTQVIENYLYAIDGSFYILYAKDIAQLRAIAKKETNTKDVFCSAYAYTLSVYEQRLKETDSILNAGLNKKYTWNKNDSLVYNNSFTDNYPQTVQQKTATIDKWIKLYTLRQLEAANKLEKDFEFEKNEELKVKAINKLRKSNRNFLNEPAEIQHYLEAELLQAILSACDPHSDYFTPIAKKAFTQSLSTSIDIFGFDAHENDQGQLEISSIVPGSSAWKCNNLNVGDRLLKLKFKNKAVVDVADYDVDEFNDIMYSNTKENELIITVVKKNGATVETKLVRAKIESEINVINSYILSKKHPIGYISLPSFYTDFTQGSPDGCANDIAKEITKLKEDSIQGLILDLRNNGGGSVKEATNLAGIFIDAAPLFTLKTQSQKPKLIKDLNRGAIYTGPLIVLINKGSASASELLAQILKTQHRAIIVGSESYGKATGQIIVPLDTTSSLNGTHNSSDEKDGSIKITVEKLFDLNGTTYQKIGVKPHISIPDLWSSLPLGEKTYRTVLSNEVIDKKIKIDALPDSKIDHCADLSKKRVSADAQFKRFKSLGDTVLTYFNDFPIPIYPPAYFSMIKSSEKISDILENASDVHYDFLTIAPNKSNGNIMQMDKVLESILNEEIENLKKDLILRESYNILTDYILN